MEWMILPFKRYFDFKGRSRRKEFWMYTLFVVIVSIVLSIVDSMLGLGGTAEHYTQNDGTNVAAGAGVQGGLLANLFALATFIPNIAVAVRRLHDTNRSGWWILMPAVPMFLGFILIFAGGAATILGGGATGPSLGGGVTMLAGFGLFAVALVCSIVLLVWYCMSGTPGPNRFGEDPKGQQSDVDEVFG